MKQILIIFLALVIGTNVYSQSIEELYSKGDLKKLIEYADSKTLTKEECYYIGYAFFQLEDDANAIKMYDLAIEKGLDDDYIYLYKGLAFRYDKQYEKANENFKLAINRNPNRQKNYTELGNSFLEQEQYDSALVYFRKARDLNFELGDPYYNIPYIYHLKENFEKALEEYQIGARLINKQDPKYIEILKSIGQLEYTVFHRYENAVKAYSEMISLVPNNFDLYPKLIKACYANGNFKKGDSLFKIMKVEYENARLSEEYQKYGSVSIAEFEWNGQKVCVYRYFKTPEEILDIMYKIYLLSKDGQSIERTLMIEKTLQIEEDGAKHLLCEREKSGAHRTYLYGWSTDDIDFESLKKSVIMVFEKEVKPQASSNFDR